MASKVLSAQSQENVALWQAPSMEVAAASGHAAHDADRGENVALSAEVLRPMTAEELENLQASASQEGFQQGREEGLASGREEVARQAREWAALIEGLAQPLRELDDRVVEELMALAVAVARQIVRRELQTAPDEIVRVIREALEVLPSHAADVRVELHPLDAELVRESMPDSAGDRAWRVVEDPALSRGGCRIKSDASRVDATVERRLNQAIAAALGGMRSSENP